MQTLPASALSFSATGFAIVPWQPFSNVPVAGEHRDGQQYRWSHEYVFDYRFAVPWTFEAGTYTTVVTYTAVPS